ncbi:MAG: SGNH/GDSL hydrolase family protein [Nocardioidaceae bacterium]|nr:SGNH/GDSL hydrolase family protein [Nocardioidaceae bacterium]
MTALIRLALGAVVAVLLAGCGAGGFTGDKPDEEPRPPIRTYVAIGDGFAAAPEVGRTDPARGCRRGAGSYPAQVAKRLGVPVTDVTCTGATTRAMLYRSAAPDGKGELEAQIDAVTEATDLVTITAGITDDNLLQRGFYVCMEWPCAKFRIPAQQLATEATTAGTQVTEIVRQVLQKAPNAYVVLVGYPKIAPPKAGCDGLPRMDANQLVGVNYLFDQVNKSMRSAAQQTGTQYADLSTVSDGHDACSATPWVRSPKGDKKLALLPLAPAQKAAADAVIAALATR